MLCPVCIICSATSDLCGWPRQKCPVFFASGLYTPACLSDTHLPILTLYTCTVHAGGSEAKIILKWSKSAGCFLHRDLYGLNIVLAKLSAGVTRGGMLIGKRGYS